MSPPFPFLRIAPSANEEWSTDMVSEITRRFAGREDGQDLLEYGLLASLIALVALGAVTQVGDMVFTVFWDVIAASIP